MWTKYPTLLAVRALGLEIYRCSNPVLSHSYSIVLQKNILWNEWSYDFYRVPLHAIIIRIKLYRITQCPACRGP